MRMQGVLLAITMIKACCQCLRPLNSANWSSKDQIRWSWSGLKSLALVQKASLNLCKVSGKSFIIHLNLSPGEIRATIGTVFMCLSKVMLTLVLHYSWIFHGSASYCHPVKMDTKVALPIFLPSLKISSMRFPAQVFIFLPSVLSDGSHSGGRVDYFRKSDLPQLSWPRHVFVGWSMPRLECWP